MEMVRVGVLYNDLDQQIALLKFYPELVEKHFKKGLQDAAKLTENEIRPNIPVLSGKAKRRFRSRLTGKGIDMKAQIGWWDADSWYMRIVESGAKPHKIEGRNGGMLRFGGTVVKSVNHPGFSARGFMAAGFSAVQPQINAEMKQASDALVNELAVK